MNTPHIFYVEDRFDNIMFRVCDGDAHKEHGSMKNDSDDCDGYACCAHSLEEEIHALFQDFYACGEPTYVGNVEAELLSRVPFGARFMEVETQDCLTVAFRLVSGAVLHITQFRGSKLGLPAEIRVEKDLFPETMSKTIQHLFDDENKKRSVDVTPKSLADFSCQIAPEWFGVEGDWGGELLATIPSHLIAHSTRKNVDAFVKALDQIAWACNEGQGSGYDLISKDRITFLPSSLGAVSGGLPGWHACGFLKRGQLLLKDHVWWTDEFLHLNVSKQAKLLGLLKPTP